jgi:hypothetical protein
VVLQPSFALLPHKNSRKAEETIAMKSPGVKNSIDSKRFSSKYFQFIDDANAGPRVGFVTIKKITGVELEISPMLTSIGFMENY